MKPSDIQVLFDGPVLELKGPIPLEEWTNQTKFSGMLSS